MFNINDPSFPLLRLVNYGGARRYVHLMTEYMKLSPSYDLARRYRLEELSEETLYKQLIELYQMNSSQSFNKTTQESLLKDFERVLKTFDEYGDLTQIKFRDWWYGTGMNIYNHEYGRPHLTRFGRLDHNQENADKVFTNLHRYLREDRVRQNNPPTIFVAIPLGMTRRNTLAQLSAIIDLQKVPVTIKAQKPKRTFTAKRLHYASLRKYLNILKGRATNPDMPLWKLGINCEISPKNKDSIAPDSKPNSKNADHRIVLGVLTSRALKKAMLIAEHAARGDFPLSTPMRLPKYDWDKIYEFMCRSDPKLTPR